MEETRPPATSTAGDDAITVAAPFYLWYTRVFTAVGLGLIIYSGVKYWQTAGFVRREVHVSAEVTGYHAFPPSGKETHTRYLPILQYADGTGKTWTVETGESEIHPAYPLGQRITLVYDSAQPGNACLDTFGEIWGGTIFTAALGCFASILGFFLFLYVRAASAGTGRLRLRWWDVWFGPIKFLLRLFT